MRSDVARNISSIAIVFGTVGVLVQLVVVASSPRGPVSTEYGWWWYSGVLTEAVRYTLLIGVGVAFRKQYRWALPAIVTLLLILALDSVRVFVLGPGYLEAGVALVVFGALGYCWWGSKR